MATGRDPDLLISTRRCRPLALSPKTGSGLKEVKQQ